MEVITKGLILKSQREYYIKHLSIINNLLPVSLTQTEMEILSMFLSMPPSLIAEGHFNPITRKMVMEDGKFSPGGLSNHLTNMVTKGFLDKSDLSGRISIKPFVLPDQRQQGYRIKITLLEDGV